MKKEEDMDNRAKQFVPFAAVKGFEEALRAKEKIVVEKIELSDEMREELDYKLHQIFRNDIITVVYFSKDDKKYISSIPSLTWAFHL